MINSTSAKTIPAYLLDKLGHHFTKLFYTLYQLKTSKKTNLFLKKNVYLLNSTIFFTN